MSDDSVPPDNELEVATRYLVQDNEKARLRGGRRATIRHQDLRQDLRQDPPNLRQPPVYRQSRFTETMAPIPEDSELNIFPLRDGVTEQEFKQIAARMGLKREKTCPSLASVGACFLGIAIGGLSVTSAAVLLPCLTSLGETAPAADSNSNFRERRSNECEPTTFELPSCHPVFENLRLHVLHFEAAWLPMDEEANENAFSSGQNFKIVPVALTPEDISEVGNQNDESEVLTDDEDLQDKNSPDKSLSDDADTKKVVVFEETDDNEDYAPIYYF